MANTVEGYPHIGAVWQRVLNLWELFAQGAYTSYDWGYSHSYPNFAWVFTVGLPAGGTETHTLISMEMQDGNVAPLEWMMTRPGWTAMPSQVYPDTLPSSDDCVTSFENGPKRWKADVYGTCCGATLSNNANRDANTSYGVTQHFWLWAARVQSLVVIDGCGVTHGSPTIDQLPGATTSVVGSPVSSVSGGGGGGSVDLGPVVDALEDIATMDVEYQANNGGQVWSMRGKVRTP